MFATVLYRPRLSATKPARFSRHPRRRARPAPTRPPTRPVPKAEPSEDAAPDEVPENVQKLVDELCSLNVIEMNQLVKSFKDKVGLTVSPPWHCRGHRNIREHARRNRHHRH